MGILVFGSLNMDLVVQAPRLPVPGETILGHHFQTLPGGKGANQAVAAARQQVPTRLVGCVGADAFGQTLRHTLAADGVNTEGVRTDVTVPTGTAAITVSAQGENQIVVVPGANSRVGSDELDYIQQVLPTVTLVLMQCEIPLPMVTAAAQLAYQAGVTVVVDPAPVPACAVDTWYRYTHILTPNQVEAAQLVGFPVDTTAAAIEAARVLRQRGVDTVLITLGDQGVVGVTATDTHYIPAFAVPVVDTVAAGDAFNGGLAVALHEGQSLPEAMTWAAATAALSVTQPGAQPSMPSRSQVADFLHQQC